MRAVGIFSAIILLAATVCSARPMKFANARRSVTPGAGAYVSWSTPNNRTAEAASKAIKEFSKSYEKANHPVQYYAFSYDSAPDNFTITATFADNTTAPHQLGFLENVLNSAGIHDDPFEEETYEVLYSKRVPAPVKFGFRAFIYPTPGNTQALRELLINVGPLVDAEPFTAQWFPTQVYNKSGPTDKFIVFTFAETHEDLSEHLLGNVTTVFNENAGIQGVRLIENVTVIASEVVM